jgi:diketogulonate reductase-like aldo/keto reductase
MGEAEAAVGEFVASRRTEVTLTTKAGIEPPSRTSAFRLAVTAGRRVVQAFPITKVLLRRATRQVIRGGAFAPADVAKSLDRSLRALRTDYIDLFLLHDYSLRGDPPDELVDVLMAARKAGKIRTFGVGAPFHEVIEVVRREPRLARVVQFENSAIRRNLDQLPRSGAQFRITHGSLSESFQLVRLHLQSDPEGVRRWSELVGCDIADPGTLASLMLDYSVRANVGGLVLFSSSNANHIAANARAILETPVDPDAAAAFAALVANEI